MKKTLFFWQILGFIFTGVLGVILHFLFDWTNENPIIAPFSAVNESIWEHMKLLFFPMFVFALIENVFIKKDYKNFWHSKLIGITFGVFLIPVLYYTINGAFGKTPDFVNILIFYVTAAFAYALETRLMKENSINFISEKRAFKTLVLIAVLFVVLTFTPPKIPLFKDPLENTYGYWKIK